MGRKTLSLGLYTVVVGIVLSLFAPIFLSQAPVAKAQATYTKADYERWFPMGWVNNIHRPDIIITENTTPPRIVVDEDTTVNRPKIQLNLFRFYTSGGGLTTSGLTVSDYFVFKASAFNATGPGQEMSNLYFIVSDCRSCGNGFESKFFYSTQTDVSLIIGNKEPLPDSATTRDNDVVPANDVTELFSYTFSAVAGNPNDESCDAGDTLTKVGPVPPNTKKKLARSDTTDDIRDLSGNCANLTADGWLAKWGVNASSDLAGDSCSLSSIVRNGIGNIFGSVIACIFTTVLSGITGPFVAGIASLTQTSQSHLPTELANPSSPYLQAWQIVRSLINIIVLIALLLIAFANIFHLNINTYAAKKALPGLVVGVIGANASILLVRFIVDASNALTFFAVTLDGSGDVGTLVNKTITSLEVPIANVLSGNMLIGLVAASGGFIILILAIIFAIFFIVYLTMILFIMLRRVVTLYALTIVSPLAFIAYGIPNFQQWFGKWWDMFLRQAFVWPLLLASLAIFNVVAVGINASTVFRDGVTIDAGFWDTLFRAAILYSAAIMIIKLPSLITKGAIDISKAAKTAFGLAQAAPQTGMRMGGAALDWREKRFKDDAAGRIAKEDFQRRRGLLYNNWATGKMRKAAVIANNPSTYTDAYKKRMELDEKARKKESYFIQTGDATIATTTGLTNTRFKGFNKAASAYNRAMNRGLTGTIGGAAAEIDSTYGLAKETNQGASRREVMAWYFGGIEKYLTESDTELKNLAKNAKGEYVNKGAINTLTGEINKEKLAAIAAEDAGDREKLRVLGALIRKTNDPKDGAAFMSKILTSKSAEKIMGAAEKLDDDGMGYGYDNSQLANSFFSVQAISRARKNDPDPADIKSVAFRNVVPTPPSNNQQQNNQQQQAAAAGTTGATGGANPFGTPIDMDEPIVAPDYTPGTGQANVAAQTANVQAGTINLLGGNEIANKTAGIVSQLDQTTAQNVMASADEWLAKLDSHFANGTQNSDEAQQLIAEIRSGTNNNINEGSAETTHQVLTAVHKLVSDGQYGAGATPGSLATAIANAQQSEPQIKQALEQLNTTMTQFAESNLDLLQKQPADFAKAAAEKLEPSLTQIANAAGRSMTPQEIKRQAQVHANLLGEKLKEKGPNSLRGDLRSVLGQAARAMGGHTLTPPSVSTTQVTNIQQNVTEAPAANLQAPEIPATVNGPELTTPPIDQPPTPPSAS